jgi:site-specific recombinase XerD
MNLRAEVQQPLARSTPHNRRQKRGRYASVDRSVSDAYEGHLAHLMLALSDVSPRTRDIYLQGARRFLHFLEADLGLVGIDAAGISREHARHWLRAMEEEGLAAGAIRPHYVGARRLFEVLREDGEVRSNPFIGLKPPAAKMLERRILAPEDIQGMMDTAKKDASVWGARDRALLALLYDGGFRRSELMGIREADLDLRAGAIMVDGKTGQRWAPLTPTPWRCLLQYLSRRKAWIKARPWYRRETLEGGPIWISGHHDYLTGAGLAAMLKLRAEQAGLGWTPTPHDFRHASATAQANAHIPEQELAAKMGWSPGSKQVYRYTRSSLATRAIEGHQRYGPGNRLKL